MGFFHWLCGRDGVDLFFPLEGEKVAILRGRLRYRRANGETHGADYGLITDGTSTPPVLWPITGHPFDSAHCRESIVHDSDYQRAPAADASLWRSMRSAHRADADESYGEALAANPKLEPWKAALIYRGVRTCGWWAFYRHARRNAQETKEAANG